MILDRSKYVGVLRRDFNRWKILVCEDNEDFYFQCEDNFGRNWDVEGPPLWMFNRKLS